MNSKKLKFKNVHLKTLFLIFFCFILASCNDSIIESEQLAQEQTTPTTLKAATIGNKYYVSKTGNNSNAGTATSPYLTIQKGLDAANSGDTVFVKAGTYKEYVTFNRSGSAGSPIVLKNYGSDNVSIDGQSIQQFCIYANNKSNLVIDGINLQNSTAFNLILSGCENIIVKNSTIKAPISTTYAANGPDCIVLDCSGNTWEKNIIIQNITTIGGRYGILIGNKIDGLKIIGGRCSYASIDGINMQASLAEPADYNRNIVIDGTEIDHNLRQGMVTEGLIHATFKNFWSHDNAATGLQIEDNSSYITIEDFISENNCRNWEYETGIWIDDSDSVTVRRGIMRNNQCGFRVSNSKNVLAYNLLIYSNNYSKNPTDGSNNSSGISFYSNQLNPPEGELYVSHVELYNSVIYNNSNSYSQRGSVALQGDGTYILKNNIIANGQSNLEIFRNGANTLVSDYNIIYNTKTINIYNNSYETWSSYKASTGQDSHSINLDPLFIDAANGNFSLQAKSPAINAGINVGLTTDRLLNPIIGLPDIGATEQTTTSTATPTIYYNVEVSASAVKNSCGSDYTGSTVTYTVVAKKYSSTISQADADSKASADLAANKQTYANTNGTCTQISATTPETTTTTTPETTTTVKTTIYYNTAMSVSATKNSCGSGYEGSTVTYTVPANKYTSTISQADANNQAQADLNANAQNYANDNGTCISTRTSTKKSYWWWRH